LPKQIAATIKERGKLEIESEGIADGTTYLSFVQKRTSDN